MTFMGLEFSNEMVLSIGSAFLAGVVLTALVAALLSARRGGRASESVMRVKLLEGEREHLNARIGEYLATLQAARQEEKRSHEQAVSLERALAEARTALAKEREAHEEKVREMTDLRASIEERMKNMANDLLKENTDGFLKRAADFFEGHTKANKESVETLVKPIGEALKTYQEKLGLMEQSRKRDEGEIVQQLRQVAETHSKLSTTTATLVNALRSAPKTRGRWGEQQLRTVLEMAGMMEYVDFLTEHSIDRDDKKLRPDVVLRLPGGRQVVVDAKTPMSAYLDAVEAEDDAEREAKLALHAQQLKAHAQQLGSKAYWDALGETPDFVVMFVPGDNLYSAAIERDPDLFEFAYDRQVIVATPTTFLALAKAVAFGWRQEQVSRNAQKVLTEGTELYKRLQTLGSKVLGLSKSLDTTVARHNELVASLETRVLPQGRKFHALGIGTTAGDLADLNTVERTAREPMPGKDLILDETKELAHSE